MSQLQDVVSVDIEGPPREGAWGRTRALKRAVAALQRRHSPAYLRCLTVLVAVYICLYGLLLGVSRGVPYVTDGNESFSMLVHASNMYRFPLSATFGLSDEALSPDPAAHPYVYTHQGNFPRLYSLALYAIGATSAESQIVITTFSVGLVAMLLAFHYVSLISSVGFAFVAVLVLLTDYLFFAQWQVNTFRVWHGPLLFLPLLAVHGAGGPRWRQWLAVTLATFTCLFYFELAFATFVAVMSALYAALHYGWRPAMLVRCWVAQGAGAAVAVLLLIGQLIGYLGWSDFVEDLRLTYTARNLVAADPSYADRIREFMESRHIVFWYNFATTEFQRSPVEILSSLVHGHFAVYTPTLWYFMAIVAVGWLAAFRAHRKPGRGIAGSGVVRGDLAALLAFAMLVICAARFSIALLHPDAAIGVAGLAARIDAGRIPWAILAAAVVACVSVLVLRRVRPISWKVIESLPVRRIALAAGVLFVSEHVVVRSGRLFDFTYLPLWLHIHSLWLPGWAVQLLIATAGGLAVTLVLTPSFFAGVRWPRLAKFLLSGLLAYVVVYTLSPGYVQSGYLRRWVPFASFVIEIATALAIYVAWRGVVALMGVIRQLGSGRRATMATMPGRLVSAVPRMAVGVGAVALVVLLMLPGIFWIVMQGVYVQLLPPTHFQFVKQLREPPFRGASFAVNTYAAPVYTYTGQWAYFDTRMGAGDGGAIRATDGRYEVGRDASTYLWLADREVNRHYLRPDYFLCVSYQDPRSAAYRLAGLQAGCSSAGIVRRAVEGDQPSIVGSLVARDPSPRDAWAIVKLDWSILDEPSPFADTPPITSR